MCIANLKMKENNSNVKWRKYREKRVKFLNERN